MKRRDFVVAGGATVAWAVAPKAAIRAGRSTHSNSPRRTQLAICDASASAAQTFPLANKAPPKSGAECLEHENLAPYQ
jgi:hypothetical protein